MMGTWQDLWKAIAGMYFYPMDLNSLH
jgi:hypothetical protein